MQITLSLLFSIYYIALIFLTYFYDTLNLKLLTKSFPFLQNFYNSVSLATENYFYLLYTKYIKGIDSPESTLPILYYARPMVSIFVAMSAFFQPTQDDTITMIILIVNTERTRTWTQ